MITQGIVLDQGGVGACHVYADSHDAPNLPLGADSSADRTLATVGIETMGTKIHRVKSLVLYRALMPRTTAKAASTLINRNCRHGWTRLVDKPHCPLSTLWFYA